MKKTNKHQKIVTHNRNKYLLTLGLMFFIGAIVAGTGALLLRNNNPTVLVWAADKDVNVPNGLVSYLERTASDDCKDYKGTGSVTGVALFSVFDSYEDEFVKMTYGCGSNLTNQYSGYILAIKDGIKWKLSSPTTYFVYLDDKDLINSQSNILPNCTYLRDYEVPAAFESKCAEENGVVVNR